MLDTDEFIADCIQAAGESEPRLAVKDVLERAMQQPDQVAHALPATRSEVVPLYTSDTLSVVKAVWAPGMGFRPPTISCGPPSACMAGRKTTPSTDAVSGGRELRVGDVALLGDDTIHAVENPRQAFTGAIHAYGGDITARPGRSEWDEDTGEEVEYDFERIRGYFESFQDPATT